MESAKQRKTKIVCTLGPAVQSPVMLQNLIKAGMNAARFNFSHGDHEYHRNMIRMLRDAVSQTGIPVALLADTKGPEIRTGEVKDGKSVELIKDSEITLTTETVAGTCDILSVSYEKLPADVMAGSHLLIADGLIDLEVTGTGEKSISCRVVNGGTIGAHKNVNVIGVRTKLPPVSEKDRKDLAFIMEEGFDFVAASFVRKASDIREIRRVLESACPEGGTVPQIIAKIEDEEGLSNLDDIIRVSSGIMVARGDLGVQLPPEEIPLVQKRIIGRCIEAGKLVIVATQMLDSMTRNPLPTRAETADVANAIMEGTDAVMLSGETAQGNYPVESVSMMHRIAVEVENSEYGYPVTDMSAAECRVMSDGIARSAVLTAGQIKADAIVAPTYSGNTPRLLSRYRPDIPIVAVTPFEKVRRALLLYRGVCPLISDEVRDSDAMIKHAFSVGMRHGVLKPFDRIVLAAGIPIGSPIMLNTVRVEILAEVIAHGERGFGTRVSGSVLKVESAKEAEDILEENSGVILAARYLDETYIPLMIKVAGYVVEHFSSVAWSFISADNPGLVAVAGAPGVFDMLHDGEDVTIDGTERLVLRSME